MPTVTLIQAPSLAEEDYENAIHDLSSAVRLFEQTNEGQLGGALQQLITISDSFEHLVNDRHLGLFKTTLHRTKDTFGHSFERDLYNVMNIANTFIRILMNVRDYCPERQNQLSGLVTRMDGSPPRAMFALAPEEDEDS